MKLGHIFHALGWSREDMASMRNQNLEPQLKGKPIRVSASAVSRSAPRKDMDSFGASVNIDEEAVFRLANRKFDPHHMSLKDSRNLAALLQDAGAGTRRDVSLLSQGPISAKDSASQDEAEKKDMIAAWQAKLHKEMASQNFQAVDQASRALTLLGRVVAAQ